MKFSNKSLDFFQFGVEDLNKELDGIFGEGTEKITFVPGDKGSELSL